MSKSSLFRLLYGLILAGIPLGPAHAGNVLSFVSFTGRDTNPCDRANPCQSLHEALTQTIAGGTIMILDTTAFGALRITQSVTIVNDVSATALICCDSIPLNLAQTAFTKIQIDAGPNDVVTLRGLTIAPSPNGSPSESGVQIGNAHRVNIEKCLILNETSAGILVAPASAGTLAGSIAVNIEDTVANGNGAGLRVTSVPNVAVSVSVARSSFNNNTGAGIRIDGTSSGTIAATIADAQASLNGSNGIIAISGPGSVAVNVARSVMASNALYGVQSNQTGGGSASIAVEASKLTNNSSGQVGVFGGGTLLTAGNNLLVGANGTGFSGPIGLQ